MKSIIKFTGLTIVSLALMQSCGSDAKKNSELEQIDYIAVKTAAVKTTTIEQAVIATGLISTENETRYSFKIGGVIDRIYVSEGQSFKKGELLASLKLDEIDAGVAQAKLGFEKVQRDFDRINNLYKDSIASLEQLQNTKTALDVAQKQLESATFNRQYSFIYANESGFVTQKLANQGEIIAGGYPVLATNTDSGKDWILKVGVSDKDWSIIELGNEALIKIDAYPERAFKAWVSKKSQAADPYSGSFGVDLRIEPTDFKLAVGMFAKANIKTQFKSTISIIPYDAMIEADGSNAFIFIPVNQNGVKKVPVEILSFNNLEVYVKAIPYSIEEVIVTNSAFINERSFIKIIK